MKYRIIILLVFLCVSSSAFSRSGFTLWQLPSQVNTIGNSYVMQTSKGSVVVIDGGMKEEESYLRGFLAALGNEVEAWFVSHPHNDHVGAITEILKNPNGIKINRVYESAFPPELLALEAPYSGHADEYYEALAASGVEVVQLKETGLTDKIDGLHFKVLGVTNPEITSNPYNNSSLILRVWDKKKSIVFLGDAGIECGDKALAKYPKDFDCDYLQMAHHGQRGCSEEFYKSIRFKACLWPTPSWVWDNVNGDLETLETRR